MTNYITYGQIFSLFNEGDGHAYSEKDICDLTGLQSRRVEKIIGALVDMGFIEEASLSDEGRPVYVPIAHSIKIK